MDLSKVWKQLLHECSADVDLEETHWKELEAKYDQKNRHYHNLDHLRALFKEFEKYKDLIHNKEAVAFSIFYHDIIYNPLRKDNELRSAKFLSKRLSALGINEKIMSQSYIQILATAKHQLPEAFSEDDKLFLDFDLEILSRDWGDLLYPMIF